MSKNKYDKIAIEVEVNGKIVSHTRQLSEPIRFETLDQNAYKTATEMLYNVLATATRKTNIVEAFKALKTINGYEVNHGSDDTTGNIGLPIFNEQVVNAMFGKFRKLSDQPEANHESGSLGQDLSQLTSQEMSKSTLSHGKVVVEVEVDGQIVSYTHELSEPLKFEILDQQASITATKVLYNILAKATQKTDLIEAFKALKTINGHEVHHMYDTPYFELPISNELAIDAMLGRGPYQQGEVSINVCGDIQDI